MNVLVLHFLKTRICSGWMCGIIFLKTRICSGWMCGIIFLQDTHMQWLDVWYYISSQHAYAMVGCVSIIFPQTRICND